MKTALQTMDETLNYLTTKSNRELYEISIKIDEAVKNGKCYICEQGKLNSLTVYELQKLGYGVTNDYNDSTWYYFISWMTCDVYKDELVSNYQSNPSNKKPTTNTNSKRNKGKFPIFRR